MLFSARLRRRARRLASGQGNALRDAQGGRPGRCRRLVRVVKETLTALCGYGAEHPYLPAEAHSALMDYRLGQHGFDYGALAEVAPALGVAPIPVADQRWYDGVAGLDAVQQPAA
jgi:hypothetical protein